MKIKDPTNFNYSDRKADESGSVNSIERPVEIYAPPDW